MNIEKTISDIYKSDEGIEFIKMMRDSSFSLSDTNISSRVYNLWKNEGLLDIPNQVRKWVKMNLVEYIWLNMVRDMRAFGLSFEDIRKVKQVVLQDTSKFNKEAVNETQLKKAVIDLLKLKFKSSTSEAEKIIEDMKKESNITDLHQLTDTFFGRGMTYLEIFLLQKGVMNWNSVVVIYLYHKTENSEISEISEIPEKKEKQKKKENKTEKEISEKQSVAVLDTFIYSESQEDQPKIKEVRDLIFTKPHLQLPIQHYLESFRKFHLEKSKDIGWLSESEYEIVKLIRAGKADSISVKFKNRKPEIVEISHSSRDQTEFQILNKLRDYKHAEVELKKTDGKIVNFTVTQKYKMNK